MDENPPPFHEFSTHGLHTTVSSANTTAQRKTKIVAIHLIRKCLVGSLQEWGFSLLKQQILQYRRGFFSDSFKI